MPERPWLLKEVSEAFLAVQGIAQSRIRKDVLQFGLPALLVFVVGLVLSGRDGYDGLTPVIWWLIRHPSDLLLLTPANAAGLVLFVGGLALAIVAVVTLGRFYSSTLVTRVDHRLITHGVYRLARNPIYLGVLIACFGVPVYASSLYGVLAMALLIPIFLHRIGIEEKLLYDHFGEAYRDYQTSTSKLIPFVY